MAISLIFVLESQDISSSYRYESSEILNLHFVRVLESLGYFLGHWNSLSLGIRISRILHLKLDYPVLSVTVNIVLVTLLKDQMASPICDITLVLLRCRVVFTKVYL